MAKCVSIKPISRIQRILRTEGQPCVCCGFNLPDSTMASIPNISPVLDVRKFPSTISVTRANSAQDRNALRELLQLASGLNFSVPFFEVKLTLGITILRLYSPPTGQKIPSLLRNPKLHNRIVICALWQCAICKISSKRDLKMEKECFSENPDIHP
jgi:hypothetical protein